MRLFLIDPYGIKYFYQNRIFDYKKNRNIGFFSAVKEILAFSNIKLATIDMAHPQKADALLFFDFNKPVIKKILRLYENVGEFKKKSYLFINECPLIKKANWTKKNHKYFSKVFLYNDAWVDNKKYFHYHLPIDPSDNIKMAFPFKKKKLLTLVNGYKLAFGDNELYSKRIEAIRFFEKEYPADFDLYGVGWNNGLSLKFAYYLKDNPFALPMFIKEFFQGKLGFPSYRGQIDDNKKLEVLSRYKFAVCFENMTGIDGYITEKIFDCFKAKCVPIYWGANNINKYIPENTYIDFRKFGNYKQLYNYIDSISEKKYNIYIDNITKFMKSYQFKKWSPEYFVKNVMLKL